MNNLLNLDQKQISSLCQKNDVAYLGVFGSFAKGQANEKSDIDLLVRFTQSKSLLDLVRLENAFGDLLKRKVDLVTEQSVSPYLREQILFETKKIYEQP